jgi:hypothetical protein
LANATEMRQRAERRLGELMDEARAAGNLAKPPGGSKSRPRKDDRVGEKPDHPTLADLGIDKNLADRARKAAEMSDAKFEKHVAETVRRTVAAADGDKKIIAEARAIQQNEKRQHREIRERSGRPCGKSKLRFHAMPQRLRGRRGARQQVGCRPLPH